MPVATLSGDRGIEEEDEGKGAPRPNEKRGVDLASVVAVGLLALCLFAGLTAPGRSLTFPRRSCWPVLARMWNGRKARGVNPTPCSHPPTHPSAAAAAAGRRPGRRGAGGELRRRRVLPDAAPPALQPHARGAQVRGVGAASLLFASFDQCVFAPPSYGGRAPRGVLQCVKSCLHNVSISCLEPPRRRHNKLVDHFYKSLAASGAFAASGRGALPLEWSLLQDCTMPALAHPDMAVDAVQVRPAALAARPFAAVPSGLCCSSSPPPCA